MKFLPKLRSLFRKSRLDAEMDVEMRTHLELQAERNRAAGMDSEESRYAALRQFGNVASLQERAREQRGMAGLIQFARNFRLAGRTLWKNPAFASTVLTILALCIGANLAIFAVVDSILLRPLPFPDADRLVTLFNTYPKAGVMNDGSSLTNYYERRGNIAAFSSLAIYREGTGIVGETGATERQSVMRVSPEFFASLGAGLAQGRAFTEEETTYQTDGVAILTDTYWRQRFDADPNVLGREIRVDGLAKMVVGVLPRDYRFLSSEARLYFPLSSRPEDREPEQRHSGGGSIKMIARLAPGVSLTAAQAQIDAHNAAVAVGDPAAKPMAEAGFRTPVIALHADHVAAIRPMLLLIQAGALFLLLIGMVNLVNLLLIRASARAKELAVRQALGASRGHVISEVLAETTLLALAGGVLGLLVGAAGIKLLAVLGTDRLPLGAAIAFDGRLACMALLGAGALGAIIAVPIAWFNLRARLTGALHVQSRGGTTGPAAQRLRHSFIVAQIALAFVLLAGAGLLRLSLNQVNAISPGFRAANVLSGRVLLPFNNYETGVARLAFTEKLVAEISRQPSVSAAGVATNIPFSGDDGKSGVSVVGYVRPPGESLRATYSFGVDGDYFVALGLSRREGRFLTAADSRQLERVCVVDEDFARRYWPQGSAIGQRLGLGGQPPSEADAFTVVGVVGTAKQADLAENEALGTVYFPYGYRPDGAIYVVVRTSLPPHTFGPILQHAVRQIDPELPVSDLRAMETRIADSLVARRSPALLTGIFAGMALLLTGVGTYGVLSYAVAQRRREIGVRIALGARPQQIRSQFLVLGLRLLALGLMLGGMGTWWVGQALQGILFDVPALHVMTLMGAGGLMGLVSLIACLLPAHRAAKVDPMVALRAE